MLLIIIFVIVSVLLAVVIPKYSRDLSAARVAVDGIGSQLFSSSFGDIEYLLEGEGPVVLVSHGITGGHLLIGHEEEIRDAISEFMRK